MGKKIDKPKHMHNFYPLEMSYKIQTTLQGRGLNGRWGSLGVYLEAACYTPYMWVRWVTRQGCQAEDPAD